MNLSLPSLAHHSYTVQGRRLNTRSFSTSIELFRSMPPKAQHVNQVVIGKHEAQSRERRNLLCRKSEISMEFNNCRIEDREVCETEVGAYELPH